MQGSKISGTVTNTVTLGSGAYPSPLTITASGAILPAGYGQTGVYADAAYQGATLVNQGSIAASVGQSEDKAGAGGIGIDLQCSAVVTNSGTILGGVGGIGGVYGGAGGVGVYLNGGTLSTTGFISGGTGGADFGEFNGDSAGGGGVGVVFVGVGQIVNGGTISGGAGGSGRYENAGGGGVGVILRGAATLTNSGNISGGVGGVGGDGTTGEGGGAGVSIYADATLLNHGNISGGEGFESGVAGVMLVKAGSVMNTGTITGGGGSIKDAPSGAGIVLGAGGMIYNSGLVSGAAGGGANHRGGGGGSGVEVLAGGTVLNSGTIVGGAGGNGLRPSHAGVGVYLDGGTLINSGTISGGLTPILGDSILFGTDDRGTLVVDPGAVFVGNVVAKASGHDVLVLGSGTGTIHDIGNHFIGFRKVDISAGSSWTLTAPENHLGANTQLLDAGALDVTGAMADAGSATVSGQAELTAASNGIIQIESLTLGGGTISSGPAGVFAVGATVAGDSGGTITVDNGGTLSGFGEITRSPLVDDGSVIAQGGTLTLNVAASGNGVLTIDNGSAVVAASSLGMASIAFTTGGNEVLRGDANEVTGVISGFGAGDTIDVAKQAAGSLSYSGGTLTLFDGAVPVDTLLFAGDYDSANFTLTSDGNGGTNIGYVSGANPVSANAWATFEFGGAPLVGFARESPHVAAEQWLHAWADPGAR